MGDCECKHEREIANLEQRDIEFKESLDRLEKKFDLMMAKVDQVSILSAGHDIHKETIARLFVKLEGIEAHIQAKHDSTWSRIIELENFKHKIEGMATMAWVIWSAMGISLAAIVAKVYS